MILAKGTRVSTPTKGKGTIEGTTINMPDHYLVRFDSGEVFWMLKAIVQEVKS
jgi:hypothetical protein